MTPDDLEVIFSIIIAPGRGATGTKADILRHFGATDGVDLGLRLLREAIAEKSADDLEAALIVCGVFDAGARLLPFLVELLPADWHIQHEVIVTMLSDLEAPEAVWPLHHAATFVPDYLAWNENRPLASKAIWALAAIEGAEAREALAMLTEHPDEVVRETAQARLRERR